MAQRDVNEAEWYMIFAFFIAVWMMIMMMVF